MSVNIDLGQILIAIVVGVIGWLIARQFRSYDKMHELHFQHSTNTGIHGDKAEIKNEIATNLELRHKAVDAKFDDLSNQIKAVGSTLSHHAENDMLVSENITDNLKAIRDKMAC